MNSLFTKTPLTIELVPRSAWYSNLRDILSSSDWDKVRRASYRNAKYRCEVCNGRGPKHPVECHEIWNYDDERHIQTLKGVVALCPTCHQVKHTGLAQSRGLIHVVINQLMKVNGWSKSDATLYIEGSFEVYYMRSRFNWDLDLNWLSTQNYLIGEYETYIDKGNRT